MAEKLNEDQFRKLVRKIIKENVADSGDVMDQSLNTMDGVNTTSHPNIGLGAPKKANKPSQNPVDTKKENSKYEPKNPKTEQLKEANDVEDKGDVTDVKMNTQDSKGGHDKKIAAAVEVEAAGGVHNGDSTKGMSKSKFDSKKGMNNSTNENGGDDKGTDATEADLNTMDKDVYEGTKTYVEAGAEDSTGQRDAKWSETAKKEKEDTPIADAIQLPENFGKEAMSGKDLLKIINEEAKKLSKLI